MNRKGFLKNVAKLTCAAATFPLWWSSCKSISYVPHTLEREKIVVKKTAMGEALSVIVKPPHLSEPIFLTKLSEGKYSAVLMRCTHKGCEVRPSGNELQCPCHGSVFSKTGEVLESPAEHPLKKFQVTSDHENIYIW